MASSLGELFVSITADASGMTSTLSNVTSQLNTFGSRMGQIGSSLQGIGTNMSLAVTTPLAALGGFALNTAVDFDDSMRKVQAVTGETGEGLQKLTDYAMQLGAETAFSSSQAADAMLQLGQAGFSVDQIMTSTNDVMSLASAGALDLGTAAGITANAMNGFGLEATDTAHIVDILAMGASISTTDVTGLGEALSYVAPAAHSMGMSIEETTSLIAGLSNAGIEGSRAGTSLAGSINALATPTDQMIAIFGRYNISLDQVNPATRTFTDILDTLTASGVSSADVMALFGREAGPGVLALLSQGTGAIREQTAALQASDGAAQQMAETMEGGTGGAIRQLQGSIETLQITLGNLIASALTPFIERATDLFNQLSALPEPMLRNIVAIAGIAAAAGPTLVVLGTLLKSIGTLATAFSALPVLIGPVGIALAGLAAAGYLVYSNWNTVGPWLQQQFLNIRVAIDPLIDRVRNLVTNGFQYISNWWNMNGQGVMNALTNAFQRVIAFIAPVYDAVRNLVVNAFQLISNWWSMNGQSVMNTLYSAFNQIRTAAIPLITTIRDLVERALNGISNWWGSNGQSVLNGLNTAFTWLINTGASLATTILDFANRALIAISNWWSGSGSGAFNGLWQMFTRVADAVRPLIPIVISFVQDSLTRLSSWWSTNGRDIIEIANKIGAMIQWAIENVAIPSIRNLIALLPTISALFAGTRDFIMNALSIIINVINHDWAGAWDACKKLVSDAWEDTKGLIGAALTYIGGLISERMNSIRASWGVAWQGMLDAGRNILNTIYNTVANIINSVINFITGGINRLTSSWSSGWNGILTTASNILNSVVSNVSERMNSIVTTIQNIINRIKSMFSSGFGDLPGIASTAMSKVVSAITGYGSSLYSAGASAGQQAVNGLASKVSSMQSLYNQYQNFSRGLQVMQDLNSRSSGSSGSTGITRQGSDGTGESRVRIVEAHATGGVAGYTGFHWMEKGEIAVPEQTDWSKVLATPMKEAMRGILTKSGNVTNSYGGDTFVIENANFSNDYDVDKLFAKFESMQQKKRLQRGFVL